MSTYYKYAQFDTITSLANFSLNYQMAMTWTLESTTFYKYQKIEISRYIGPYNTVVTNPDITLAKTVYTATQRFTGSDYYSPYTIDITNTTPISTVLGLLISLNNFTDNLSIYNNTNSLLKSKHGITDTTNDKTLLKEIANGQRFIYYFIQTSIKGVFNTSPYCVASHFYSGVLDNTSTKTQVRYNILNLEGDLTWVTKLNSGIVSPPGGLSRTVIDTRLLDTTSQGISGTGGHAWVTDRTEKRAYRCNLSNGLNTLYSAKFLDQVTSPAGGMGICVDMSNSNGDIFTSSYHPVDIANNTNPDPNAVIYNIPNTNTKNSTNYIETNINGINGMRIFDIENYGLATIPTLNDRIAMTNGSSYGARDKIVVIQTKTAAISVGTLWADVSAQSQYNTRIYSLAAGPDGTVFTSPGRGSTLNGYDIKTIVLNNNATNPSNWHGATQLRSNIGHITCTMDNYGIWPNIDNSRNKYHVIFSGANNGMIEDITVDTTKDTLTTINTTGLCKYSQYVNVSATSNHTFDLGDSWQGVGIDGENNIWGLGQTRTKIYRVQQGTEYPLQGLCRYPPNTIGDQPYSNINTPEIEWFLLRDSGYVSVNQRYVGTLSAVGTVDNQERVSWNGTTATAHEAWWSLVDNKRFELDIRPSINSNAAMGKNPTGGFAVKKYNNNTSDETRQYGIRPKDYTTNFAGCLTSVNLWYDTYCNPSTTLYNDSLSATRIANNLKGRRVFPWYGGTTQMDTNILTAYGEPYFRPEYTTSSSGNGYIPAHNNSTPDHSPSYTVKLWQPHGETYVYSDFTGNLLQGSIENSVLNQDTINPFVGETSTITISSEISAVQSGGFNETIPQCYPWNTTILNPIIMSNSVSGYDNLTVFYRITATSTTGGITAIDFNPDDYDNTTYTLYNDGSNIYTGFYTYNNPSKNGLTYLTSGHPVSSQYFTNRKGNGNFVATITLSSSYNLYTGNNSTISFNPYSAMVFERWPEPKMFLNIEDINRTSMFCATSWGIYRYDKSAEVHHESNAVDALRNDIVYGVDPLHVEFQDRSIARTYPISSWNMTLSTNNPLLNWSTKQASWTSNPSLSVLADTQNFFDILTAMDFRYGNYKVTLNVSASTTSTSSDKEFVNYINVAEFEPFANFWASSASTVDSNYSSDNLTSVSMITGTFPNGKNTTYEFVSGYAPNLTVYFQESSEAHTFPISQYNWNFGDYYNEGSSDVTETSSNYYTICSDKLLVTGDFNLGCWTTNYTAHTAAHTYIMPGTYDVTLTVKASTTNTMDTCSRYIESIDDVKKFYIYVKEILPTFTGLISASNNSLSGFSTTPVLTGLSPQTYYFVASNIQAGSFPICKMVWDFGDGITETILRSPSAIETSQGLSLTYHSDPRYTIIPHTYSNDLLDSTTYSVGVSAYACNTNSMISLSSAIVIGPIYNKYIEQNEQRRLIGSRFDTTGNLVYVFEGMTTHNTYTMAITGEM